MITIQSSNSQYQRVFVVFHLLGVAVQPLDKYASLDGDADRIVYFYLDKGNGNQKESP